MTAIDTTVYPRTHTGIGLSDHKTHYTAGVKIGNWVEESGAAVALSQSSPHQRNFSTTYRTTFNDTGKTGAALTENKSDAVGNAFCSRGQPADRIFYHKLTEDSPTTFFATTTDLAYSGEPRRVQDYLWSASKFHNRGVPTDHPHGTLKTLAPPTTTRRFLHDDSDPYTTTSKVFFSKENFGTRSLAATITRPQDPEGQPASVGRKAKGEFAQSLEAGFLKTGLRRNLVPGPRK